VLHVVELGVAVDDVAEGRMIVDVPGDGLALDLHVHPGGGQPLEELPAASRRHTGDGTV